MKTFPAASHRQITDLRKLSRRRHRQESARFLADGRRTVEQLIHQGRVGVVEVYCTQEHLDELGNLNEDIAHFILSSKDLRQISETETPQGVLALCEIPASVEWDYWQSGHLLAFDRIQDPGNMGTMIRTACWFGFDGLIVGEGTVDQWNPKTVRSTVGATGLLPYAEGDLTELLDRLAETGWNVALLDGNEGSVDLTEWSPGGKAVVVVGNEAHGVSDALRGKHRRFRIEGSESQRGAESLNAAVAASLAMFHAFQRRNG